MILLFSLRDLVTRIPRPSGECVRITILTFAALLLVSGSTASASTVIHDGPLPIGEFLLMWDGRNDNGEDPPSGAYFANVATATGGSTAKLVLSR
jgi:hypothetical protein